MDKFWAKVDVSAGCGRCWPFCGPRYRQGYGQFKGPGGTLAHRTAWVLTYRQRLVPGDVVMHTCDNPPCCNPQHLVLGTTMSNIQDKIRKGRMKRCAEHGSAKLTWADVLEIRALYPQMSQDRLAARFGVSQPSISAILRNITWKDEYRP